MEGREEVGMYLWEIVGEAGERMCICILEENLAWE